MPTLSLEKYEDLSLQNKWSVCAGHKRSLLFHPYLKGNMTKMQRIQLFHLDRCNFIVANKTQEQVQTAKFLLNHYLLRKKHHLSFNRTLFIAQSYFSFVIQTFKSKTGKYQPLTAMLSRHNQPHLFKLHTMDQKQKDQPGPGLVEALSGLLPSSFNRRHKSSLLLMKILTALPDLFFTLAAAYYCKRRVDEKSTCMGISKEKHYHHQTLFLNKKTRLLLFILEIVTRNLLVPLFSKFMNPKATAFEITTNGASPKQKFMQKVMGLVKRLKETVSRSISSAQDIMSNVEWMTLIVYLLDWNKHFTFIQAFLGIPYGYTHKIDQIRDVSYAIEGYMLLLTCFVKAAQNVYSLFSDQTFKTANEQSFFTSSQSLEKKASRSEAKKENIVCRICSDEIKKKSSTKCGHVFCWSCIIKTLENSQECPVCHSHCEPRQVAQLRNH